MVFQFLQEIGNNIRWCLDFKEINILLCVVGIRPDVLDLGEVLARNTLLAEKFLQIGSGFYFNTGAAIVVRIRFVN